ncbi:hypothetical protein NDK43_22190 [Neobacillus pocheonensis]|uniref:Uncharacterized protein n=1 Tax=Neobacillus pocheonensis TaxID=363869 RepID=A0ABT0WE03_9BACI|nr:hypothetical protein [Neobacillus pocheonensis]
MKVAPTVLAEGKGGDNVKPLPICHEKGLFSYHVRTIYESACYLKKHAVSFKNVINDEG